jgi:hypothetical protein
MNSPALTPEDRVLILGGSGFVGKRLITELAQKNIKLRLLVRDLAKAAPLMVKGADIEVVQGDRSAPLVLKRPSAIFTPPIILCTPWVARPCSRTKCTRKRTALPRRTSLRLRTQRGSNGSFTSAVWVKRMIIFQNTSGAAVRVPVLSPILSAYWVDPMTPIPSGIAHPLIEGLRNEVVCKDDKIDKYIPIAKTTFAEAVRIAHTEEKTGPGIKGF